MKKRQAVRSPAKDKKFFKRTAMQTKKMNSKVMQFRGGIRL